MSKTPIGFEPPRAQAWQRKLLLALAAAAVLGLGAWQWLRPAAASGGNAVRTVNIAAIAHPFQGQQIYSGLTGVIIRDGWLKAELAKRGVELAFTPVPTAVGGPLINEGFSGKRIDFASYGDFPAVIAVAGGVPLKLVAPLAQGQETYIVVRNGLQAASIADLKGKRIALHRGRPWELPFSKLLDANGLKFSDFTIVNINPSATPAALSSGSVDAAVLLADGLLAQERGIGKILWSTKQAPRDWKMRAELFGRADFVNDNPQLTQLVVDAYLRAAAWSAQDANRDQVIKDSSRGSLPINVVVNDLDPRISWRDRYLPYYDDALRSHYRSVTEYALKRGLVREKVDADALLDDRFVQQGLKDLDLAKFWSAAEPAAAQGNS
ncbi:ABC transporter substrate-binding protein [Novosphingobium flavum]|uniref:ABC transporter substrate-binding protein n=1 Tax=Novosphingobium flavum TaxID=1778672 RepID=UPI0031B62ED8